MPAITFPPSPTLGQEFVSGNRSWAWNGTTWSSSVSYLTGPQGPAGIDGIDGAPGATGETGPIGPVGNIDNFTLETIMSIY